MHSIAKSTIVSLHGVFSQNEGSSVQGSEASLWTHTEAYNQTRGKWVRL